MPLQWKPIVSLALKKGGSTGTVKDKHHLNTDLSSLASKKPDLFPLIVVLHSSKSLCYPKLHIHYSQLFGAALFFVPFFFSSRAYIKNNLSLRCQWLLYFNAYVSRLFFSLYTIPLSPSLKCNYKSVSVVNNTWQECVHFLGLVWWGFLISRTFVKTLCHWRQLLVHF